MKFLTISAQSGFVYLFWYPQGYPILSPVCIITVLFWALWGPKGLRYSWGVSKVLGSTSSLLSEVSWKSYPCLLFIVLWHRMFWGVISILSDGIFGGAVFPRVLWGGEDKIKIIEEFVSNIFWGFFTDLPCHIVVFQSAVWVRCVYSILKLFALFNKWLD